MSLNLDRSNLSSINLRVLQRMDQSIAEVLGTAGHVVVYLFNEGQREWERADVEGSLFVVKRAESPRFRMIVMNRLNTTNLEQDITEQFQLEVMEPYIIFKCIDAATRVKTIHGIWFYEAAERTSIFELITRVVSTQTQLVVLQQENERKNHGIHAGAQQGAALLTPSSMMGAPPQQGEGAVHLSQVESGMGGLSVSTSVAQKEPMTPSSQLRSMLGIGGAGGSQQQQQQHHQQQQQQQQHQQQQQQHHHHHHQHQQGGGLLTPSSIMGGGGSGRGGGAEVVPVNKEVLKEAIIDALEDDSVMNAIHAAYVRRVGTAPS